MKQLLVKVRIKSRMILKSMRLLLPKQRLKSKVKRLAPVTLENDGKVTVSIFCGRGELYEGVASLYSFYYFSDKKYPLHWHEDGTLSASDISYLNRVFPNIKIIRRADADVMSGNLMASHSFHFMPILRSTLIFGVRLVDINYYADGKWVLQLDSDVLFLEKPTMLLENMQRADKEGNANWMYNKDIRSCYCTSSENIYEVIKAPVIEQFNSGVTFYKAAKDNIGYLESVCAAGLPNDGYYYWEQTLFAILMTRYKALPLPDNYDVHYRFSGSPGPASLKVVSRHYCGNARDYFYRDFDQCLYRKMI